MATALRRQFEVALVWNGQPYALGYGNHWNVENPTESPIVVKALTDQELTFQAGCRTGLFPLIGLDTDGHALSSCGATLIGFLNEGDQPVILDPDVLSNLGLRISS